ncbi:PH domain-containing protein [Nocardia sp. XZ_19_385]|uniref:PH domain-containing protein n=1 Tax=Nocardia sp. XZ_19_385 TaxID=2769488 RepID=UPI002814A122|nr:PH domain-containing protein [Nocardia sp. XZ_19_385]
MKVIRIPQTTYIGVVVLFFCVFFFFAGWPKGLWWLLLIPLAVVLWIERTRTTVSDAGLDLRTVFRKRHIDWDELKGVSIPKRGYVRAHLNDGSQVKLPAVGYDRLRALIEASKGRIPDLFAAAEEAEQREYEERKAAEAAEKAKETED